MNLLSADSDSLFNILKVDKSFGLFILWGTHVTCWIALLCPVFTWYLVSIAGIIQHLCNINIYLIQPCFE